MKRPSFAMITCALVLVFGWNDPLTSYGNEAETEAAGISQVSQEDEWRALFLEQVEQQDNISYQKEEIIKNYLWISKELRGLKKNLKDGESKILEVPEDFEALREQKLSGVIHSGNQRLIIAFENWQVYLIRLYSLLLKKERLNVSIENQEISESEYWEKTKEIDGAIFRLDYLHNFDVATSQIHDSIEDLTSKFQEITETLKIKFGDPTL